MKLPDIPEGGFRNSESFERWLEGLDPETLSKVAPVLAARAALRASVFVVKGREEINFQVLTKMAFRIISLVFFNLSYNKKDDIFVISLDSIDKIYKTESIKIVKTIFDAILSAYNLSTINYNLSNKIENAKKSRFRSNEVILDVKSYLYKSNTVLATSNTIYSVYNEYAYLPFESAGKNADRLVKYIFVSIVDDIDELSSLGDQFYRELIDRPLWIKGTPDWWLAKFKDLKAALPVQSGWDVWTDWLQCRIDGTPTWNLPPDASREIQQRVALGDGRDDFWEREPEVINAEIAGWLREQGWGGAVQEPKFDFFLSYSKSDLTEAKFISDTLEDNGYSVFSQLNDMRTGNFIDHMNTGLKGMARFLAVYSPDYFASNACKAEFQAALTFDPSGNNGKFVPFMVHVVAPPPLLRGIIYQPLYGLSQDDKAKAILQAVTKPVSPHDRKLQRQAAKSAASPDVVVDSAGRRIDSGKNAEFDDVHADTDLFDLPERMRQIVDQLLQLLVGKNNCNSIQMSLKAIHGELSARGLDCSIGLVADQMEFIEIDLQAGDAALLASNDQMGVRFRRLTDLFALMRSHYPLDQKREAILRHAEVEIKTTAQMEELHQQVSEAVQNAADHDLVTDQYQQVIENRIRVTRDILSLPDPVVPKSADIDFIASEEDRLVRVQTAKRRALAQDAAVADKTIEVAASLATIADSTAGKALIEVMKRLGNWIWGG